MFPLHDGPIVGLLLELLLPMILSRYTGQPATRQQQYRHLHSTTPAGKRWRASLAQSHRQSRSLLPRASAASAAMLLPDPAANLSYLLQFQRNKFFPTARSLLAHHAQPPGYRTHADICRFARESAARAA